MDAHLTFSGAVLIFCLVVSVAILYLTKAVPLTKLPGPWHTKYSNIGLKLAVITGQRIHYIHRLHERYGDIVRIAPREVSVSDVESYRQVYIANKGYWKDPWYWESFKTERLGIFFLADPAVHAPRRRLLLPSFSKSMVRLHWEEVVRSRSEFAVQRIFAEAKAEGVTDILKWWILLANDIAVLIMFGESFKQLEMGEKSEYIHQLENVVVGASMAYELPFIRALAAILPIKALKDLFATSEVLLQVGQKAVLNARSTGKKQNIFAEIIRRADDGEGEFDALDVQQEAGNLTAAASDTTGYSLTYMTWLIMSHPKVRSELEKELSSLPDNFKDSDLERLSYLNAVILESLRLYGAAPGTLPRSVPKPAAIIHGYEIPGDITIGAQSYTMHRRADYFTDPLKFDPERWFGPQSAESKSAYAPFGHGNRLCLGIEIARMELRYAAALLFTSKLGRLELAPSVTEESMVPVNFFIIKPAADKCEVRITS